MSAVEESPASPTAADYAHPTPGPWREHAPIIGGETLPFYRFIEGGDGCASEVLGLHGFHISGYIHEADARLMAAAPELLAALQRLLGATSRGNADMHEPGCGCVVHEAEAAIAKAIAPQPDDDPTPWCHVCGAMKRADCNCGPIADNE